MSSPAVFSFSSVSFSNFVTSFTGPSEGPTNEGCGNIEHCDAGSHRLPMASPHVECGDDAAWRQPQPDADASDDRADGRDDDGYRVQVEAMKAPARSFDASELGRSASAELALPYEVPPPAEADFRRAEAAAAVQAADRAESPAPLAEDYTFDADVFETAESQIGAVRQQTKELVLMLFRMKCDKDVLHKELHLTRDAVDRFDQRAHAEAALRADFDRHRAEAEDEIAQLRDAKRRLEGEIDERRRDARTAEAEVRAAQMMVSGLDRSCDDLEQYLDGAGMDVHASSQSLSSIRTKTKAFREEFANLRAERDKLAREVEESKRQSITTTSTFIEMITEMARAQAVIERTNYEAIPSCGSPTAILEPAKDQAGVDLKDTATVSTSVVVKHDTGAMKKDVIKQKEDENNVQQDSAAVNKDARKQKEDKNIRETPMTLRSQEILSSPTRPTAAIKKTSPVAPPHWRPSPPSHSRSNVENSRDDDDVARSGSLDGAEFVGASFAGAGAPSHREDSLVDSILEEPGSEDDAGSGSGWDAMAQIVRAISPTVRRTVDAENRDGHDDDGSSTGSSSYDDDETAGGPSVQTTFTDHDTASYTDTDDSAGHPDLHLSYDEDGPALLPAAAAGRLDVSDAWGDDVRDRSSAHGRAHMVEMHRTSTEKTENVSPRAPLREHRSASPPARGDHHFETLEELRCFMNGQARGMEREGDSDVFLNGYESTEEVRRQLDATLQEQGARVGKFNNLEELRDFYAQRRQGRDSGRSHGSTMMLTLTDQESLDVDFDEEGERLF